ncbi:hypothetical protein KIL84_010263 [Mauremys mutica]|uniref:Secreted protein n=1 Tax=Mauremys mutica TaxID=74926 RepID=A0A9D3XKY5_9SAUR|nr:hypothetical protein KIL84_010263 [Mauremys mutica]
MTRADLILSVVFNFHCVAPSSMGCSPKVAVTERGTIELEYVECWAVSRQDWELMGGIWLRNVSEAGEAGAPLKHRYGWKSQCVLPQSILYPCLCAPCLGIYVCSYVHCASV